MLTLQEVSNLLNKNPKKYKVTDIIRLYRDVYYGMSLHTTGAAPKFYDDYRQVWVIPPNYFGEEYQRLFDSYLLNRHPRESEVTRNWRYSQYRPLTKAPFQQVVETIVGAIFQDSGYSITLNNQKDNEYIWGQNFQGKDIIQYFEWAFNHIFEDPNGKFLRIPKEPWNKTTTQDVQPDIWFIPSHEICHLSEDEFLFKKGDIAWLVNKVAIFRYVMRNGRWELLDDKGYYAHMLGYLPISVAGGVWNTQGYFDSWGSKAKPRADDFISSKSAEQLVDKEASHPFIVEAETDCPECEQSTGYNMRRCTNGCEDNIGCEYCVRGYVRERCGNCGGTGKISHNPGMRMIVPADQMNNENVQIINPDVNVNKYLAEKNKDIYWQILDALNLTKVEEAQSGVAKAIDQERLFLFVSSISNDLFGRVITESIRDIIAYRNVATIEGIARPSIYDFKIIKPSQFQIKTASDLLEEYDTSTKANLPGFIRAQMVVDFVDKQYGGDMVMKRKAELIACMDGVCTYDKATINAMIIGGQILRRDAVFSVKLPVLLDEIVREKGAEWFLTANYEAIDELVKAKFDEENPEMPEITDDEPDNTE